jgi:polysaccharide deacetylase family protein (PEP-CTERM system associated)
MIGAQDRLPSRPLNAMTVDVEDYFHVSAFEQVIDRSEWEGCERRVSRNTRRLLDLFDAHGVKATFFVLGWVAEREPELVREIDRRGHEVACHGYSHRLIYRQQPAEFAAETAKAKALLEDIVGKPMLGYRAASYSITQESLWALDTLTELGFAYDSSIFPVAHDRYGMPGSPRLPYVLQAPSGREIVEFPLTTLELARWRLPIAGGGYFRLYPFALTRMGLGHISARGEPIIFYLHPWEIDPGQPRVQASWLSRFRHYNNLHKCESRLVALLGQFRWGTVESVLTQDAQVGARFQADRARCAA